MINQLSHLKTTHSNNLGYLRKASFSKNKNQLCQQAISLKSLLENYFCSIGICKFNLVRLAHVHCEKVKHLIYFGFATPLLFGLVLLSQRNFFKDQYLKAEPEEPEISLRALNL